QKSSVLGREIFAAFRFGIRSGKPESPVSCGRALLVLDPLPLYVKELKEADQASGSPKRFPERIPKRNSLIFLSVIPAKAGIQTKTKKAAPGSAGLFGFTGIFFRTSASVCGSFGTQDDGSGYRHAFRWLRLAMPLPYPQPRNYHDL